MKKIDSSQLMDKLAGNLTENQAQQFEKEIGKSPESLDEYTFIKELWEDLDKLSPEQPRSSLSDSFYSKLDETLDEESSSSFVIATKKAIHSFTKKPIVIRYVAVFLFIISFGTIIIKGLPSTTNSFALANKAIQENNPYVTENPNTDYMSKFEPASKKIDKINSIFQTSKSDQDAVEYLTHIIENEQNTNVKLAAIYQMNEHISERQNLHSFFFKQLKREHSPMVQAALVNLLVEKDHSKKTIHRLERLIKGRHLNPNIEEKIKSDLPVLRASF